jgi:predicted RNA binding protein with dsRBD fold (UPF0201 family)
MKVTISTPLFATENKEKILKSLTEFFPEIKFKSAKKEIKGENEKLSCLHNLRECIIQKQVKNTVRYLILQYQIPGGAKLMLNKQSFVARKIHFVEEEYQLGNINVVVETEDIEKLLDYLTGIKSEA